MENSSSNPSAVNLEAWDPKSALSSLADETMLGGDTVQTAERLFRENAPQAALSIVHLAQHSLNEATRLKAAQYVVDRVLGRPTDAGIGGKSDPFESLLADCVSDYEGNR